MTLIELREMCAKIADDEEWDQRDSMDTMAACGAIAKGIRAIQLPEQKPVAWMNPISRAIVRTDLKILGVTLEDFAIPLYAAPPSVDVLEKQVAELKESLRWVVDFVSPDGSYDHKELQLARERAK